MIGLPSRISDDHKNWLSAFYIMTKRKKKRKKKKNLGFLI